MKPTTASGTALFLCWQGYHVFSIPKREICQTSASIRFFGVGGKRNHPNESFVDCALREGQEEIGDVVAHLNSAEQTYFLKSSGILEPIDLRDEPIRPQLIWEKQQHSNYGSMAHSSQPYYLVAFNASLSAKPSPNNELAAILYLTNQHLSLIRAYQNLTLIDLLNSGAVIDYQAGYAIADTSILIPHGTVLFLMILLETPHQ